MKGFELKNKKTNSFHVLQNTSLILVCLFFLGLLSNCGKDKDSRPYLEDGYSRVIYDLEGDTETSMGGTAIGKEEGEFKPFYFSFKTGNKIVPKANEDIDTWLKTADWDLAFTGPYNSEIFVNNANFPTNPGYQGKATNTAVVKVNRPYNSVKEAPSDAEFDKSTINKIGWHSSASQDGWFEYVMDTHIMQAIPNQTYLIRLQNGNYVKLELISAYLGMPKAVTNLHHPAPYYTFRYFIQKDGSKNLNTNP